MIRKVILMFVYAIWALNIALIMAAWVNNPKLTGMQLLNETWYYYVSWVFSAFIMILDKIDNQ